MRLLTSTRLLLAAAIVIGCGQAEAQSYYAQNQNQSQGRNPNKRINDADIDSLGGNDDLMGRAQALDPDNRSRIVQKRTVDRYNRLELGINYGGQFNTDPYLNTQSLGAAVDFHINPHWSIGARYYDFGNSLNAEGQRVYDEARAAIAANAPYTGPDVDPMQHEVLGIIDWYPIYGKLNLFDKGIAQFDFYFLGGGGQMTLLSGPTAVYTGGAGVGFWINNHFTIRLEARYERYTDQIYTGPRQVGGVVGTVGLGFML